MNLREVFFKSEPKLEPNLPFPRCQHRSRTGRQCSQPICSASPEFCFTHKPKPEDLLIAELTEAAGALSTPEEIHRFLTKVTLLRVQGRITPKESGNYAFLCQILQQGQRNIAYHQKLREDRAEREADAARSNAGITSLWNIPRPDRSDPSDAPKSDSSEPADADPSDSSSVSEIKSGPVTSASDSASQPSPAGNPPPSSSVERGSSPCHPACPERSRGDRRSASFADRSGGTAATNPTQAHVAGISTPSTEKSPMGKSDSPKKSPSAATPAPPKPLPPGFHNHFFPIDLTLPPGSQDLTKNIPHPDAAECARRNARRGLGPSRSQPHLSSRFFRLWR